VALQFDHYHIWGCVEGRAVQRCTLPYRNKGKKKGKDGGAHRTSRRKAAASPRRAKERMELAYLTANTIKGGKKKGEWVGQVRGRLVVSRGGNARKVARTLFREEKKNSSVGYRNCGGRGMRALIRPIEERTMRSPRVLRPSSVKVTLRKRGKYQHELSSEREKEKQRVVNPGELLEHFTPRFKEEKENTGSKLFQLRRRGD